MRCSCDIFFESFLNYISASNLLFSLNWAGIFTRTWEVNLPFTPNVFRWIAVNLCQNKWRGFQQTKGYFSYKFLCFLTWQNENVQSDILQLRNFKKNKWNRRSIYVTISISNKACTLCGCKTNKLQVMNVNILLHVLYMYVSFNTMHLANVQKILYEMLECIYYNILW